MDDGEALDERTARRIIALLVSFACLAERAAGRSFPVRWLVLTLLRYAERVAWDFVIEATGWNWSDIEYAYGIGGDGDNGAGIDTCHGSRLGSGSSPADALALGWRLRTLAALLRAVLPPDDLCSHADTYDGTVATLRRLARNDRRHVAEFFGLAHPAPNTS